MAAKKKMPQSYPKPSVKQ